MSALASVESVLRAPALGVLVAFPLIVVLLLSEAARIAPSQFRFSGATRALSVILAGLFAGVVLARFVVLSV